MPNNELQELLGARFEEHTHPTDEAVWSAIEAQLDNEKSDRAGIWFWIFNGLAATIFLGMMFQSIIPLDAPSRNQLQLTEEAFEESKSPEAEKAGVTKLTEANESGVKNSSESNKTTNQERSENKVVRLNNNSSHLHRATGNEFLASNEAPAEIKDSDIEVSTPRDEKYVELPVGSLSYHERSSTPETGTINHLLPTKSQKNSGNYFKRLPIHLGGEFTYLQRSRASDSPPAPLNSSYTHVSNQLASKRHFEFSLFSQFDFTRRFSASIGLGYSRSRYKSNIDLVSTTSFSSTTMDSEFQLITIPLQAKFTIFERSRFALSTGLTFQGEFGRLDHSEQIMQEDWTLASPLEDESLTKSQLSFRQFTLEPFVQLSVHITTRISTFANLGYRTYLKQSNPEIALKPLNYFNTGVGLQFRLR
jgi:hypothetical protein